MRFFIDTAKLDEIQEAFDLGILDGVTTTPSLMAKAGVTGEQNIRDHYAKICDMVEGDVSESWHRGRPTQDNRLLLE